MLYIKLVTEKSEVFQKLKNTIWMYPKSEELIPVILLLTFSYLCIFQHCSYVCWHLTHPDPNSPFSCSHYSNLKKYLKIHTASVISSYMGLVTFKSWFYKERMLFINLFVTCYVTQFYKNVQVRTFYLYLCQIDWSEFCKISIISLSVTISWTVHICLKWQTWECHKESHSAQYWRVSLNYMVGMK